MFAKIKTISETEMHHFIEFLTGNYLKYNMDNSIRIDQICMRGLNLWDTGGHISWLYNGTSEERCILKQLLYT